MSEKGRGSDGKIIEAAKKMTWKTLQTGELYPQKWVGIGLAMQRTRLELHCEVLGLWKWKVWSSTIMKGDTMKGTHWQHSTASLTFGWVL
jgi:hypothetical protein